jgi:hypothetical protein
VFETISTVEAFQVIWVLSLTQLLTKSKPKSQCLAVRRTRSAFEGNAY